MGKNSCGLYFSYAGLVEMKGGGWTGAVGAAAPPSLTTCHRGQTIARSVSLAGHRPPCCHSRDALPMLDGVINERGLSLWSACYVGSMTIADTMLSCDIGHSSAFLELYISDVV